MSIIVNTTYTSSLLPGAPGRATRAEAQADDAIGKALGSLAPVLSALTSKQLLAAWDSPRGAGWGGAVCAALDAVQGLGLDDALDIALSAVGDLKVSSALDLVRNIAGQGTDRDVVRSAILATVARRGVPLEVFAILAGPLASVGVDFGDLSTDAA